MAMPGTVRAARARTGDDFELTVESSVRPRRREFGQAELVTNEPDRSPIPPRRWLAYGTAAACRWRFGVGDRVDSRLEVVLDTNPVAQDWSDRAGGGTGVVELAFDERPGVEMTWSATG